MKLLLLCCLTASAQTWVMQESGTTASLRGISAANAQDVWAGGTGGTYLKTGDGGTHWDAAQVPGAEGLDFRDVHAVNGRTAYLLSAGAGDKARIYKTGDGGLHWTLQLANPDAKGFFDALAFWNEAHGIALGDPVDGRFVIYSTEDGGAHWNRRAGPEAQNAEGAFAASGTCLITGKRLEAWFVTGGPGSGRVFHTVDGGASWQVARTPLRNDSPESGIFSIGFSDGRHGIAVGGKYTLERETRGNVALTKDGGRTWTEPPGHPSGFRSAVAWVPGGNFWIAVGTSGSDVSRDGGNTWTAFDSRPFNAVAFVTAEAGWAVGPRGAVARFRLQPGQGKNR